jgi:hypothetical protein
MASSGGAFGIPGRGLGALVCCKVMPRRSLGLWHPWSPPGATRVGFAVSLYGRLSRMAVPSGVPRPVQASQPGRAL